MIEICHETTGRDPVVFVDMSLDSSTDLSRLLGTAIGGGKVALVVDLGDSVDASSDVLTVLHRAGRHLRRMGGRLGVVAHQPSVRRLFELTMLNCSMPVFASRDEALRSWG